jgi:hypothetical protein
MIAANRPHWDARVPVQLRGYDLEGRPEITIS